MLEQTPQVSTLSETTEKLRESTRALQEQLDRVNQLLTLSEQNPRTVEDCKARVENVMLITRRAVKNL
jgi:DNA repair ATPase RecN